MSLFRPDIFIDKIWHIPPSFFKERGIKLLLIDIDNTLTPHGSFDVPQEVIDWLCAMKESGIGLKLISNNSEERVKPFAHSVDLDYSHKSGKPLKKSIRNASEGFGCEPGEIAIVGDQIFSDILGGNRAGIFTIKVEPMEPETGRFFKMKRAVERAVLRGLHERR